MNKKVCLPKLKGLPKIHEETIPARQIINGAGVILAEVKCGKVKMFRVI